MDLYFWEQVDVFCPEFPSVPNKTSHCWDECSYFVPSQSTCRPYDVMCHKVAVRLRSSCHYMNRWLIKKRGNAPVWGNCTLLRCCTSVKKEMMLKKATCELCPAEWSQEMKSTFQRRCCVSHRAGKWLNLHIMCRRAWFIALVRETYSETNLSASTELCCCNNLNELNSLPKWLHFLYLYLFLSCGSVPLFSTLV